MWFIVRILLNIIIYIIVEQHYLLIYWYCLIIHVNICLIYSSETYIIRWVVFMQAPWAGWTAPSSSSCRTCRPSIHLLTIKCKCECKYTDEINHRHKHGTNSDILYSDWMYVYWLTGVHAGTLSRTNRTPRQQLQNNLLSTLSFTTWTSTSCIGVRAGMLSRTNLPSAAVAQQAGPAYMYWLLNVNLNIHIK